MPKKFRLKKLSSESRKFFLSIVRGLLTHTERGKKVVNKEGLEGAEELTVKLIESGQMFIKYDASIDAFYFALTKVGEKKLKKLEEK